MLENLALSHAQRCFLEQVESRLIQTVSDETLQTMTNPEVKYELQTGPVPAGLHKSRSEYLFTSF